jgi:hypothetical protein
MVALTSDRNTPRAEGDIKSLGVAATQLIYAGAIVMRNAAGYAVEGATALNLIGVGRAEERVDNATGAAGDKVIRVRPGIYRFGNASAGDAITIADIGKPCYAVDDQTVAKTNGTNTRSIAGFIHDVDANGVWVEFNEARVQSHLAGTA